MLQSGVAVVGVPGAALPAAGAVHVSAVVRDCVRAAGSVLTIATNNIVTRLRGQRQTVHPTKGLVRVALCLLELRPLLSEWRCLVVG